MLCIQSVLNYTIHDILYSRTSETINYKSKPKIDLKYSELNYYYKFRENLLLT